MNNMDIMEMNILRAWTGVFTTCLVFIGVALFTPARVWVELYPFCSLVVGYIVLVIGFIVGYRWVYIVRKGKKLGGKNSNVSLASTGLRIRKAKRWERKGRGALVPFNLLSETQEDFWRLGKTVVLWDLALETFKYHDRIVGRFVEENPLWYRYVQERGQASTYRYGSLWRDTERNLGQHIASLLRLSKEIRDTEVIALAVLMDSVDYAFVCGMMFYPSNIDRCWDGVVQEELPKVVNSLVRDFGGDPYHVEERLKLLYQQLELSKHIPSCMVK